MARDEGDFIRARVADIEESSRRIAEAFSGLAADAMRSAISTKRWE